MTHSDPEGGPRSTSLTPWLGRALALVLALLGLAFLVAGLTASPISWPLTILGLASYLAIVIVLRLPRPAAQAERGRAPGKRADISFQRRFLPAAGVMLTAAATVSGLVLASTGSSPRGLIVLVIALGAAGLALAILGSSRGSAPDR